MNKAYEFLCSKSSRTVQGPDPHNIVLILKAQSILFKRYREGMGLKDKFTLMYHKISILDVVFKVDVVDSFGHNMGQGWRSGERARLPPLWPEFNSRSWRHMWAKFAVDSRSCPEDCGFAAAAVVRRYVNADHSV